MLKDLALSMSLARSPVAKSPDKLRTTVRQNGCQQKEEVKVLQRVLWVDNDGVRLVVYVSHG